MIRSKWTLACALTASLAGGRLAAQERGHSSRDVEERIERQLDQRLKSPLEFSETPLSSVMGLIADEYDLPIQFDERALEALALSPETEVTLNVADKMSLRSALNLLFARLVDVTYLVDDEVLLITTEDEANSRLEVRIYRVDDLGTLTTAGPSSRAGSGLADYDSLMGVISDCVEPDSWQEAGNGEGEIKFLKPGMYVVLQTRRVHQKIEKLLGEIRACKAAIEGQATQQGHAESGVVDENPFAER
jgi:hypothetical protein